MRWDRLFADLEAQLEAAAAAELGAEVADRARRELAQLALVDRLRAAVGAELTIGVGPDLAVTGAVVRVGPEWTLLVADGGRDAVLPLAAISWVSGAPAQAAAPAGEVEARLGLGMLLRGIARDRSPVTVVLRDGGRVVGTLDRVGADWVDIAEHPLDLPRRSSVVQAVRTVPFHSLAVVWSS